MKIGLARRINSVVCYLSAQGINRLYKCIPEAVPLIVISLKDGKTAVTHFIHHMENQACTWPAGVKKA